MTMLNISFRNGPELIEAFKRKGGLIVRVLSSRLTFLAFALGKYVQKKNFPVKC